MAREAALAGHEWRGDAMRRQRGGQTKPAVATIIRNLARYDGRLFLGALKVTERHRRGKRTLRTIAAKDARGEVPTMNCPNQTRVDVLAGLPVTDVDIGKRQHVRIYGHNDLQPALIEMKFRCREVDGTLNLTCAQAEAIAAGLVAAAPKARAVS